MVTKTKEYREGRDAKRAGEAFNSNPYGRDTVEWRQWFAGWMVCGAL